MVDEWAGSALASLHARKGLEQTDDTDRGRGEVEVHHQVPFCHLESKDKCSYWAHASAPGRRHLADVRWPWGEAGRFVVAVGSSPLSSLLMSFVLPELNSATHLRPQLHPLSSPSAMSPAPSLLFCSPLTSRAHPLRRPCRLCHSPSPLLSAPSAKRHRAHVSMSEIPSGSVPDFSDEPAVDVEYFDRSGSVSADPPLAAELPLFPLQMVLNPGTPVPLHIFELRYRLLFNRIRDADSRFGIVLYDPDSANLASIGCAAELTRFEPLPDGRIMTNNIGRERFKIVRIVEDKPYTRAIVQFVSDEKPVADLTELVDQVWTVLQDVLRLSNKLYDKVLDLSPELKRLAPGGEADAEEKTKDEAVPEGWPSPRRLEDFSFAVCQVLDMPLKEQQILLQITDTEKRLRRQNKMLQTARQYLAAQVTIKDAGLGEW